MICLGCSSTGSDRIKAATSPAHLKLHATLKCLAHLTLRNKVVHLFAKVKRDEVSVTLCGELVK